MARTQLTIEELRNAGERDLGTSSWLTVDQGRINQFADATSDHQWIHIDERAAASGPFGGTIAHGYLTLSPLPGLLEELLEITDAEMTVNYGSERIRFTSPVPSGARVRVQARLLRVDARPQGAVYRLGVEVEMEGSERPALVGEVVYLATL